MMFVTTLGEFKMLPPSNNGEVAGRCNSRPLASTELAKFVPRFFSLLLDCLMARGGAPSLLDMLWPPSRCVDLFKVWSTSITPAGSSK